MFLKIPILQKYGISSRSSYFTINTLNWKNITNLEESVLEPYTEND